MLARSGAHQYLFYLKTFSRKSLHEAICTYAGPHIADVNPSPGGGGGLFGPSSVSCAIAKGRKISCLVTFPNYSFRTLKKKIVWQGQVRSTQRVCWPHFRKVCNHVRARVFHGTISSLQVFITVPVCVIFLSHNLYNCDLRSDQIRDLYITSLWGNNEKGLASNTRVKTTQFFQDCDRLSDL